MTKPPKKFTRKEKPPRTALVEMKIGGGTSGIDWTFILLVWILCLFVIYIIWSTQP